MKAHHTLRNRILGGTLLLLLSVLFYVLHYAIFHDAHHIFIYFVGDVAFVFIEVLLVTLIIHQILSGDIKRAHALLVREWLSHMEHLQRDYPYLFSLAIRTNPFDPNAAVEMR